jgi:hypothetical protein
MGSGSLAPWLLAREMNLTPFPFNLTPFPFDPKRT